MNPGAKQNQGTTNFYNRNLPGENEPKLDKFSGNSKAGTMGGRPGVGQPKQGGFMAAAEDSDDDNWDR